jgi:hypothetical protein
MDISLIIFGILLLIITVYIIIYYVIPSATLTDVVKNPLDLSQGKIVLNSDDVRQTLFGSAGSSVLSFVNVRIGDKTPKFNGTLYPILSVQGGFSLEVAPTGIEKNSTTAQLRVSTATPIGIQDEVISLPDFPLQKWVFVGILRDGRRFDIMYNDKIVASHRLAHYPANPSQPMRLGDKSLLGQGVHCLVASERVTPQVVASERQRLADTNGAPILRPVIPLFGSIKDIKMPSMPALPSLPSDDCPPGSICGGVAKPPANAMKAWKSPYA